MRKKAVVFLAEGFEEIEAVTSIDILRRAGVNVTVAGLGSNAIQGSRGIKIVPDINIEDVRQDYDAYVLPGGATGANNLARCEKVSTLLKDAFKAGKIIAAICASPAVVLGPSGILENKTATCYPGMENDFPGNAIYTVQPVVVDGNLITSRGPATALPFALMIAEKLAGKQECEKVKQATLADTMKAEGLKE